MYFTSEKEAVSFLVKGVLPFINAESDIKTKIDEYLKKNDQQLKKLVSETDRDKAQNITQNILNKNNSEYLELLAHKDKAKQEAYKNLEKLTLALDDFTFLVLLGKKQFTPTDSELEALQGFLYWLVSEPFRKDIIDIDKENPEIHKTLVYYQEWLNIIQDNKKVINYSWRGYGKCYYKEEIKEQQTTILDIIKKAAVLAVSKSLYSIIEPDTIEKNCSREEYLYFMAYYAGGICIDNESETRKAYQVKNFEELQSHIKQPIENFLKLGEGFKSIGLCPICNNLFYKSRKDKSFDTKQCQVAASMRKLRSK